MNREQRRKFEKQLRKHSIDMGTFEQLRRIDQLESSSQIQTGQSVRINTQQIKKNVAWKAMNPAYRQFVQDSKDKIFTAERLAGQYAGMISLAEDTTEPKWVFHTIDLIPVVENVEA